MIHEYPRGGKPSPHNVAQPTPRHQINHTYAVNENNRSLPGCRMTVASPASTAVRSRVRAKTAERTLEGALLNRSGWLHGAPPGLALRHDGLVFGSRLYSPIVRRYDRHREYIASYTPEQDGLCERFSRRRRQNSVSVTTRTERTWPGRSSSPGCQGRSRDAELRVREERGPGPSHPALRRQRQVQLYRVAALEKAHGKKRLFEAIKGGMKAQETWDTSLPPGSRPPCIPTTKHYWSKNAISSHRQAGPFSGLERFPPLQLPRSFFDLRPLVKTDALERTRAEVPKDFTGVDVIGPKANLESVRIRNKRKPPDGLNGSPTLRETLGPPAAIRRSRQTVK